MRKYTFNIATYYEQVSGIAPTKIVLDNNA